MKKIRKGHYIYKGFEIIKDVDYNWWNVYILKENRKSCLDCGIQYQDVTLKECKEWIDCEV